MGFCRFTCQPWPSRSTTPSACRGIGSSASTASTSIPLPASSSTDAKVCASGHSRPRCAASLLTRVDERDDLDVGVVEIRTHVEVVDAAEADECGADRPVEGPERRIGVHAISCWSSRVLPAGSLIQICTTDSFWTPR